jgi:molecular chaperone GrpE|tara:strand:+ start:203 stop:742 length:540 start_codon:yes stop_codon:yes gene_type:complete
MLQSEVNEPGTLVNDEIVIKLKEEVAKMKDNYIRSLAEQENIRTIAKRDIDQARQFAVTKFAKNLFEVNDVLSMALEAVPVEMRSCDNHKELKSLYQGIDMTEKLLVKAFASSNIERFGCVGDIFNPNVHDAMFAYSDSEKEPGTIGQVVKVGYLLNGRVVRPASVATIQKGKGGVEVV